MRVQPRSRRAPGRVARVTLAACAALLPAGVAAQAAEPGLTVTDGWLRMVIPDRPVAGYFVLRNGTGTPQVLSGVRSPACGTMMMHRSIHEAGQEAMHMVATVNVPANGTVRFAPGGYHLMCTQPGPTLRPGHTVPVTLMFADGGSLDADFAVRGAAGR